MSEAGSSANERTASSAAVAFATTEHFTLQGARAATIAESTGRATMFLASVSGGLVALGLIATASRVGSLIVAAADGHSLPAALATGVASALASLTMLMRSHRSAWGNIDSTT